MTTQMTKHLYFNELNTTTVTKRWEVIVTASDAILGFVSFRGAWRKYVFQPNAATLYDASCLREIAQFTEAETNRWKENINAKTVA